MASSIKVFIMKPNLPLRNHLKSYNVKPKAKQHILLHTTYTTTTTYNYIYFLVHKRVRPKYAKESNYFTTGNDFAKKVGG